MVASVVITVSVLLVAPTADAQQIDACVRNSNGAVRIVTGPGDCGPSEHHLAWNTAGAPGPPGPEGPRGPAGGPPAMSFIGFSVDSVGGGTGVGHLNKACTDSYGVSRICTSHEVIHSLSPPDDYGTGSALGWVHPVLMEVTDTGARDASGFFSTAAGDLSCSGWSANPVGSEGMVAYRSSTSEAGFATYPCNQSIPVACCVPVDE
jgi:hypothetical protein